MATSKAIIPFGPTAEADAFASIGGRSPGRAALSGCESRVPVLKHLRGGPARIATAPGARARRSARATPPSPSSLVSGRPGSHAHRESLRDLAADPLGGPLERLDCPRAINVENRIELFGN